MRERWATVVGGFMFSTLAFVSVYEFMRIGGNHDLLQIFIFTVLLTGSAVGARSLGE